MKLGRGIYSLNGPGIPGDRKTFLLLLYILGFSTILSQVLILREFLVAFGGNELIIGLFLSVWMIINATGAFAGRLYAAKRPKQGRIIAVLFVTGFMPLLLLFLIDFFRNRIFLPGIQPGILHIMVYALPLLSVYCFASGFLFTRIAMLARNSRDDHVLDESYAAESLGSMTGGIAFSFVLVYFFDNLEAACAAAVITALAAVLAGRKKIPALSLFIALLVVISFSAVFFALDISMAIRKQLYPGQDIVEMQDTPYGNLTVTRLEEQLNFYQNNILLFSTDDKLAGEETVHYAMVQHQDPGEVLLISGGLAGLTQEVLKYNTVRRIDYVELDPAVFVLGSKYTTALSSNKVIPRLTDARKFIRKSSLNYDVVIMDLPEPSTLELNRYYTLEFFREVKKVLADDGMLTFSLPSTVNYMNEQGARLNSSIFNTCQAVFQHVYIYPAERNIFVASDAQLGYGIAQSIEQKGIQNEFVNPYYLDDFLTEQRATDVLSRLSDDGKINQDFKPAAVYDFLAYWMSQFHGNLNFISTALLFFALVAFVWLLFHNPSYPGMFAAGFSASSLQIILLISFQIIMGHIYRSLGLFIAIFMAGLAIGALARQKLLPDCTIRTYALLQFVLVALCCMIPVLILLAGYLSGYTFLVHFTFCSMIFLVSAAAGILFSASLRLTGKFQEGGTNLGLKGNDRENKIASGSAIRLSAIYATDMAGASLGAIITTLVLIPVAGILNTAFACAFLVLVSGTVALRDRAGGIKSTGT